MAERYERLKERYRKMFRWLVEQDLEEYSTFSNNLLYEKYIIEHGLNIKAENFEKNARDMALMIRDSTEFSTAKKAKLLIMLNCPIENRLLFEMLKEEDKDMVLNKTIYKFRSKNGEVIFNGDQIRPTLKRKLAKDPNKKRRAKKKGYPEERSSHDSLLENQEPHSNRRQHPSISNPTPTKSRKRIPRGSKSKSNESWMKPVLDYYNWAAERQRMNEPPSNNGIAPYEKTTEGLPADALDSQEEAVPDLVPTQSVEVDAPSSNSMTAHIEEEQMPVLELPKDEEIRSPVTPPMESPPVESPPVEETPLEMLKRLKTPINQKMVFELLKLFVGCLKEFDHLCPEAINNMMVTLKDTLKCFSDPSKREGISVKRVLDDFYYLISQWHGSSNIMKLIYENWWINNQNNEIDGRFIAFGVLHIVCIDIIQLLPPV